MTRKGMERRETPRVPVAMRVDIEGGSPIAFGYAENISVTGMLIRTEILLNEKQAPELGECLKLKFVLPGSHQAVSISGVISRIEEGAGLTLAISFQDLDSLSQKILMHYVLNEKK